MAEHPILGIKEQEEFPCHVDRILSSGNWQKMKDYQRGWYWHLMLLMTRSKPLGYLPHDARLWSLAGAHTKQYWESHSGLVLACFKDCEFGGQRWIYSEPLLKVLAGMTYKHDVAVERGRRSSSRNHAGGISKYSLEFETIWKNNTWKCVAKPQAFRAFEKSLTNIQQEKKCARDSAIAFLADAMEEFKLSPAGKDHGMFDGYSPPYPASWLNEQRYFDDRRIWRPGRVELAGKAGTPGNGTGAGKSFADQNCGICNGQGFVVKAGGASRCECWRRNREAFAKNPGNDGRGDERKS